jgi:hypothetical protein
MVIIKVFHLLFREAEHEINNRDQVSVNIDKLDLES